MSESCAVPATNDYLQVEVSEAEADNLQSTLLFIRPRAEILALDELRAEIGVDNSRLAKSYEITDGTNHECSRNYRRNCTAFRK